MRTKRFYSLRIICFFLGLIFLASCASTHIPIDPVNSQYEAITTKDSVTLDYKYVTLSKKKSKKAALNNMSLVSVRIKNNSGRDLTFGSNLSLTYSDGIPVALTDNKFAYNQLRQNSGAYFLYLLLTPLELTSSSKTGVKKRPIGYFLGPALALMNFLSANSANKKLKNELLTYSMLGKTIPHGGILEGIITVRSQSNDALELSITD